EIQILSMSVRLLHSSRAIRMWIEGTDPFAAAKPDARLVKLLIRARQFNALFLGSEFVPFAALAKRERVSYPISRGSSASAISPGDHRSHFRRPPAAHLTADKLLAHSRRGATA